MGVVEQQSNKGKTEVAANQMAEDARKVRELRGEDASESALHEGKPVDETGEKANRRKFRGSPESWKARPRAL
jgi:hypothetical protein